MTAGPFARLPAVSPAASQPAGMATGRTRAPSWYLPGAWPAASPPWPGTGQLRDRRLMCRAPWRVAFCRCGCPPWAARAAGGGAGADSAGGMRQRLRCRRGAGAPLWGRSSRAGRLRLATATRWHARVETADAASATARVLCASVRAARSAPAPTTASQSDPHARAAAAGAGGSPLQPRAATAARTGRARRRGDAHRRHARRREQNLQLVLRATSHQFCARACAARRVQRGGARAGTRARRSRAHVLRWPVTWCAGAWNGSRVAVVTAAPGCDSDTRGEAGRMAPPLPLPLPLPLPRARAAGPGLREQSRRFLGAARCRSLPGRLGVYGV